MSKIKVIKIVLWILTILLSILTVVFAYKQSFYQAEYSFIFLAFMFIKFDKCYIYKDIPGSDEFTYTEVIQIMLLSSKKKDYKGFTDWKNLTDLRTLKKEVSNEPHYD